MYGAPNNRGGSSSNQNYEDEDDEVYTEDTTFGQPNKSKKSKKNTQNKTVEVDSDKNKSTAKPAQEEVKKQKVVKDVTVKVDEEQIVQVDEKKQPCSLVFIGHVDAGKSTISG